MFTLLLIVHVTVSVLIIFVVLLQSGRGAELGAAFGSVGQANSVRGSMSGVGKMTAVIAVIFMVTSLSLAYLSSQAARDSVVREIEAVPAIPGSVTPGQTAVQDEAPMVEEEEETINVLEQKVAPPIEPEEGSSQ